MGHSPLTGALIRAARQRAGLTQADLAARAGTSQPVVSAYEHGHRDPTTATLRRLVHATGARLVVHARPGAASDVPPPGDLIEHGRRLVDLLGIADAIPPRAKVDALRAPRLVSR